jgi:hypothetical protein
LEEREPLARKRIREDVMRELAASVSELRKREVIDPRESTRAVEGHETLTAGQYWVRGPARIEDNNYEIVLDEDRAERYMLYQNSGLLFDLAGLGEGENRPREALAFVRRYGLLRHGAQDLGSGQCRESLEIWFEAIDYLRFAMALYQSLRESMRISSTAPLRKFDRMLSADIAKQLTDEIRLGVAHLTVVNMITDGLGDCRLGLGPNRIDREDFVPGTFALSILPAKLLDAAWSELAYIVGTRAEIRTCPGCGSYFSPESGKQKYCTRSCASTSRWRRWKERQDI